MRQRAQPWLGTLVSICIPDTLPEPNIHAGFQAAFRAVQEVHQCMSFHADDSDIRRFNRAVSGEVIIIQPHTATVLQAALQLHELSAGIFDIRLASRLAAQALLPAGDMAIPEFVPGHYAYRFVDSCQIQKLRADWIDTGGIAKGYAVDVAFAALQQHGITQAIVNAGGDIRVGGQHVIAIRDPLQPQRLARQVTLCDQAIATSASYYTRAGDAACSALFDGRSGLPVNSLQSVSVIARECLWADALTKVVAATANPQHDSLVAFEAQALIL